MLTLNANLYLLRFLHFVSFTISPYPHDDGWHICMMANLCFLKLSETFLNPL